jgi:ribonuclease BN (tRNA processing enzyme)
VGFLLRERDVTVLYSGDTYETDELWRTAARDRNLKAAFIETSFPDEMEDLARISKHLTPSLLAKQLQKLKRPDVPVYIYHLKPRFRDAIQGQLERLGIRNLTVLEEEQEITIS